MSIQDARQRYRICGRCGGELDTMTDSWQMPQRGRIEHVTCPASPQINDLPAAAPTDFTPKPGGLAFEPPAPRMLTMAEAGQVLRVTVQTVRRWIRAGRLPARRVAGSHVVLVQQSDVLALLTDANAPGSETA